MIEQATEVALGTKSQDRQSSSRRAERRAADKVDAKTIAAKVKASLVLDAVMPNGEKLGYCRGRTSLAGVPEGWHYPAPAPTDHTRTTNQPHTQRLRPTVHHKLQHISDGLLQRQERME